MRTKRNLSETISRRLLPMVRQPSQYVGLEHNRRNPDFAAARLSVAMAFPDAYTIGISHLGSQILYNVLNDIPGVACDRTYCPSPDAEEVMRREGVPLFGWESRMAVGDFDLIGFSLGYELCVTNVLTMLDIAGVPLRAENRDHSHPIIVGGDALADTPEPIAPFFDVFISGDGETPLAELAKLMMEFGEISSAEARRELLSQIARKISDAYVPSLYESQPNSIGMGCPVPKSADVPAKINRACLRDLSDSPAYPPLVPMCEAVHERVVVEIMRGCPNSCRFCQAGAARLPVRIRKPDEIMEIARRAAATTGFDEIGLLSLSTSDYPNLGELIGRLNAEFSPKHISISLPSLRASEQLKILPELASKVRKSGLTIAAEAGSERLRQAIKKGITEQDMIDGISAAWQNGWRSVKIYFLAGLPGETPEDIDAIFHLCKKLSDTRRQFDGQPGAISASVSWLVPKPHTPMQWCRMQTLDYMFAVRNRLRDLARRSTINFKFHRIERSLLEGVLCRGDRRIADVIEGAWRSGARMDAWDDHWDYAKWQGAFEQAGLTIEQFIHHDLPVDQPTPWSHIVCYRDEKLLAGEYEKMLAILNAPAPSC